MACTTCNKHRNETTGTKLPKQPEAPKLLKHRNGTTEAIETPKRNQRNNQNTERNHRNAANSFKILNKTIETESITPPRLDVPADCCLEFPVSVVLYSQSLHIP